MHINTYSDTYIDTDTGRNIYDKNENPDTGKNINRSLYSCIINITLSLKYRKRNQWLCMAMYEFFSLFV